jgi:ribokinase
MKTMPRLVVVGSSNTDLVVRASVLPRPGQTVVGADFSVHPGGKGANQAVAAARAGAHVQFVARIGSDAFGDATMHRFVSDRIETGLVTRSRTSPSGVALITIDRRGENLITVAPGSNADLTASHVRAAAAAIREARVVLAQLEVPLEAVSQTARLASGYGVPLLLNPAPARRLPAGLMAAVAFLTPNEGELGLLTGRPIRAVADIPRAAHQLLLKGVLHVIVTRGSRGVCWCSRGSVRWFKAPLVRAVDTVGAGDCFSGAFAAAIARDETIEDAIRFAMTAAAICVTRQGAQPSMPLRREILARLS